MRRVRFDRLQDEGGSGSFCIRRISCVDAKQGTKSLQTDNITILIFNNGREGHVGRAKRPMSGQDKA